MTNLVEIKFDPEYFRASADEAIKAYSDMMQSGLGVMLGGKYIPANELRASFLPRRCICCGAPAHLVAHD